MYIVQDSTGRVWLEQNNGSILVSDESPSVSHKPVNEEQKISLDAVDVLCSLLCLCYVIKGRKLLSCEDSLRIDILLMVLNQFVECRIVT